MRDRLWKRRVREGRANPFIPKEEVENDMRSPKNPKSDASDSEARTLFSINSDAETFTASEAPVAIPSKYKSVFPTKMNTFPHSKHHQPISRTPPTTSTPTWRITPT